ncbi:high-affinity choline transporter 1 [Patella vulgata]|uniref:high-affinity choline transporter 1 n=1 Tax=Patella vulgata TaxID=6465 RepID=UPI00217FEBA9|nr:high-affinity choline transporter 1 [Patella vulgata]
MTHPAVDYTRINSTWKGEIQPSQMGSYFDIYCLLIFGGIPWQVYIQRCLACKTPQRARIASFVASIGCFLFAVPAACLGIAAAATDWNQTTYGGDVPIPATMMSYVLPLALQHLCPAPVAIIGLGAISAAVMSSADSSILSSASVFAMNIFKPLFRPQASDGEISWVIRISVLVCGLLSTLVALSARSVYGLYVLCSDLMYVIMFPQLICILYFKGTNAYGSVTAFVVSFTLRIVGGESLLSLPALVHYPFYSPEYGQNFPFRTFAMITSFLIIVSLSKLTEMLFRKNLIPKKYDVLMCLSDNIRENGELSKSNTPRVFKNFAMDDMSNAKRRPGFEET